MDIMSTFYQTFWADDVDDSSYRRIFDGVTENTVYTKQQPARREKDFPLKQEDEAKRWASAKGTISKLSDALLWVRFLRMILRRVFGRANIRPVETTLALLRTLRP
jgi:hypothetical protein